MTNAFGNKAYLIAQRIVRLNDYKGDRKNMPDELNLAWKELDKAKQDLGITRSAKGTKFTTEALALMYANLTIVRRYLKNNENEKVIRTLEGSTYPWFHISGWDINISGKNIFKNLSSDQYQKLASVYAQLGRIEQDLANREPRGQYDNIFSKEALERSARYYRHEFAEKLGIKTRPLEFL